MCSEPSTSSNRNGRAGPGLRRRPAASPGLGRRGSVAVEFALISPVALLLLIGLIDFGLAIYDRMQLFSAVRAGVQYATLDSTDPDRIRQTVLDALTIDRSQVTVDVAQSCECANGSTVGCTGTCGTERRRTFIHIDTTQRYQSIFTYPGLPNPVTFEARATVRIQ